MNAARWWKNESNAQVLYHRTSTILNHRYPTWSHPLSWSWSKASKSSQWKMSGKSKEYLSAVCRSLSSWNHQVRIVLIAKECHRIQHIWLDTVGSSCTTALWHSSNKVKLDVPSCWRKLCMNTHLQTCQQHSIAGKTSICLMVSLCVLLNSWNNTIAHGPTKHIETTCTCTPGFTYPWSIREDVWSVHVHLPISTHHLPHPSTSSSSSSSSPLYKTQTCPAQ